MKEKEKENNPLIPSRLRARELKCRRHFFIAWKQKNVMMKKAHDLIDEKKRMLELIKRKFTFIIETEKHELVGELE